ncbi:hypothetical protein COV24_00235 [candidate division WWE3 bacterium CG10_big_fil_rev_8_21_14_0_10_32_10]|uniref:Uncharacterized protein n=1 Tax=candidate division WWE3 bacterium CG10_big_fil_rev_8_21_14_0_10_32_10 TaxID=1975090 RepID=A0A2H0RBJ2_UNCKA|nr:MAG: hypothetical protein COV24_00235 [candidate division WWE3 bacterium CG10_big_fil_rev_8_21_14_0_10_32_10]
MNVSEPEDVVEKKLREILKMYPDPIITLDDLDIFILDIETTFHTVREIVSPSLGFRIKHTSQETKLYKWCGRHGLEEVTV